MQGRCSRLRSLAIKAAAVKGLASVLQELARRPEHGAVVFSKPQLAIRMADLLLEEIRAAPGHHEEVAQRRPIVRWVLEYPLRSHHSS